MVAFDQIVTPISQVSYEELMFTKKGLNGT